MGELIAIDDLRARRAERQRAARPTFFFDVACPLSYLTAERVERTVGNATWVPVASSAVRPDRDHADLRERAQARAAALRLPLVWPDRYPGDAPCALRAASRAAELGAGRCFALAATRLAFCGGFDLEDPETLAEAAAAAGVPLDECLAAAGDVGRDEHLRAAAHELRSQGVDDLPAISVGGRLLEGEAGLLAARATVERPVAWARPLAPVC